MLGYGEQAEGHRPPARELRVGMAPARGHALLAGVAGGSRSSVELALSASLLSPHWPEESKDAPNVLHGGVPDRNLDSLLGVGPRRGRGHLRAIVLSQMFTLWKIDSNGEHLGHTRHQSRSVGAQATTMATAGLSRRRRGVMSRHSAGAPAGQLLLWEDVRRRPSQASQVFL